jgi:ABC-type oligopeptide transport system substrate-binding subunit
MGYPTTRFLWLNMGYKPLGDHRVRKAMALVLDQQQLVMAFYGSQTFGVVNPGVFISRWGLSEEEFQAVMGWDRPYEERVAEAQRLMAEAGYPDGFKLRMVARKLASYDRLLSVAADLWQRHLKIQPEIVSREVAEAQKMRDARDFDVYLEVVYSSVGDPDEDMGYFMTDGPNNFTGYTHPRLDRMWEEQSRTLDQAKRQEIIREIERILLTDLPMLPTGFLVTYGVSWYPQVKNFSPQTGLYSATFMEQVWLAK